MTRYDGIKLVNCLLLALILWSQKGWAVDSSKQLADAVSQEKAVLLLQKIIQDYWKAEGTNTVLPEGVGNVTNAETAFREACSLLPGRLDLRFCVASTLLGQATQTNGTQLKQKLQAALDVYREIQTLNPNGFDAPILYAAYTRAAGDTNASQSVVASLMPIHPKRTAEYLNKFDQVDRCLQVFPSEKPPSGLPKDKHHAIVLLGAGLETNGAIKKKLTSRLEQCLKLARMYPRAPIILTGGNQKGGVTEAYMMFRWLAQRRVSQKRLILEDKARDTVENALFSSALLQKLGVSHVTLVTSVSHLRRGLADLEEACRQRGLNLEYATLAARSKSDPELDAQQERLGVYRDVMRVSGLWAYPGLQR